MKTLDAALRAPRRELDETRNEEALLEAESLYGSSIERELAQLIAQHGPDPERIVSLLAERAPWEQRIAERRLATDYGRETAEVLIRSAANHAIYDTTHPAILRLRAAAGLGSRGHGQLLAETVRRRARGERTALPHGIREQAKDLPAGVRSDVERATGRSLDGVKVVTGPEAGEAVRAVGAIAVTTDGIIILPEARTDTAHDRAVLAHEATHALQQRGGGGEGAGLAGPAAEREAETVAFNVMQGRSASVDVSLGQQAVARTEGTPAPSSAENGEPDKIKKQITFTLGGATCQVEVEIPNPKSAGSAAAVAAGASANGHIQLPVTKLNALLPPATGIHFTGASVDLRINGDGKIAGAFTIGAHFDGKGALKPCDITFNGDTTGKLSATLTGVKLEVPGLVTLTAASLTVDDKGISGDIHVDGSQFTLPHGATITGNAIAKIEHSELKSIDGALKLTLPQGFGTADLAIKVSGGNVESATATLKSTAIPGLQSFSAVLQWSKANGFELPEPGVQLATTIPGLKGTISVSCTAGQGGFKFNVKADALKFTSKALENLTIDKIDIGTSGLKASISIANAKIDVPGWFKMSNLHGTVDINGAHISANNVGGSVTVGDKASGSFTCSLVDGAFKASVKINKLDVATKFLSIGNGLTLDFDLGTDSSKVTVGGTITGKLGTFGTAAVTGLALTNGHFTGKCDIPITGGPLAGIRISVELKEGGGVEGKVDTSSVKKLSLPFKGPVELTVDHLDLTLSSDLSDFSGNINGQCKVDGGKLAEGDYKFAVKDGHVDGDVNIKVKPIPMLKTKAGGEIKLHVHDTTITGSGSVTLEFDKYIKGDITVGYDTAKGFSVQGKGLTIDPALSLPVKVTPFDVSYADGKLTVPNITATLIPGKVPGVSGATFTGSFVNNILTIEMKDVTFSIPQLKKTTLTAKWSDGKWAVAGTADLDLPKGLKAHATFGADNGKGNDLNFNASIELSVDEVKKVIPGVEITSGKIAFKYEAGKLHFEGADLGIKLANGVLGGNLHVDFNEADKTFNFKGNLKLTLKFIKAKDIEVVVDHNVLKRIAVTGLELDMPIGKGTLTGNAAYEAGKFSCDLTASITDVPWVQSASAHVVIQDGKWTGFDAHGKFKPTPGIDLSKLDVGGKLDGGTPMFFCDGPVPIKGIKEPLTFHFAIGQGKWEAGLKGSFDIKGLGHATASVDMKNDGFRGDLAIVPTNQKVVKAVSGFIAYSKGSGLTFGGSITVAIASEFEGTVGFEKLEDGDFEFKGEITPTKKDSGEPNKKKELFSRQLPGLDVQIPLFGLPFGADVHVSAGVHGGLEAGFYLPAFSLVSCKVSGKLSELEKGELPDADIQVKASAGLYAAASIGLMVGVGITLLGASLDLQGSATGRLEINAMLEAIAGLKKVGNQYTLSADIVAKLQAALQLILALDLVLTFLHARLWSTTLASKTFQLGSFDMGEFPLKKFEYTFGGPKKEPTAADVTPKAPDLGKIKDKGIESAKESANTAIQGAKAKIDAAKEAAEEVVMAPVHAAEAAGHAIGNAASAVWHW